MEVAMKHESNVESVVAECVAYWTSTGVPRKATRDMQAELTAHLHDAAGAGKTPSTVVGPDVRSFAESWASAYRDPQAVSQGTVATTATRLPWWVAVGAIALVTAGALAIERKKDMDDIGIQIAFWAVTAVALAIGEIFTAGFFLISFAVGAGVAAALAASGVSEPVQILVFLVVSVIGLVWTRQYALQTRPPLIPVGADRYVGDEAVVERAISRHSAGRVRVGSEDWRAVTDSAETFEVGAAVTVVAIRGTSLVIDNNQ
jgi:inner membrane protein